MSEFVFIPYSSTYSMCLILGMALNSTQLFMCSRSTLNKFQMPRLMISIEPVIRVTRFGFHSEVTEGDKVIVQLSLITKFKMKMM